MFYSQNCLCVGQNVKIGDSWLRVCVSSLYFYIIIAEFLQA